MSLRCHLPTEDHHTIHQALSTQLAGPGPYTPQHLITCVQQYLDNNNPELCGPREPTSSNACSNEIDHIEKSEEIKPAAAASQAQSPSNGLLSYLSMVNAWSVECFSKDHAVMALRDEPLMLHKVSADRSKLCS